MSHLDVDGRVTVTATYIIRELKYVMSPSYINVRLIMCIQYYVHLLDSKLMYRLMAIMYDGYLLLFD